MLQAGLDLSRRRLDVCLLAEHGELVAEIAVPADADGLRGLARRLAGQRVHDRSARRNIAAKSRCAGARGAAHAENAAHAESRNVSTASTLR
jgi:hypothetical protein